MNFKQTILLVALASLLFGCGESHGPGGTAVATLQMAAVPVEQLPESAVMGVNTSQAGVLMAQATYGSTTLLVLTLPVPPPAGGGWSSTGKITLDFNSPQAVAAGRDAVGRAFVVVGFVDYAADQSVIHIYTDTNADGLPDASAKTVLGTYPSTRLKEAALDVGSGTLYMVEALSDSIFRFADTNGDKKPDGVATLFQGALTEGPLSADSLASPTSTSVLVFRSTPDSAVNPHRHIKVTDTNGDGMGDVVTTEGPSGRRIPPYGRFANPVFDGDSKVSLLVSDTQSWKVVVVTTTSTETIATFTGTTTVQTVVLDRTVYENERLRIQTGTGTAFEDQVVRKASSYILGLKDPAGTLQEQGTISFVGRFINGNETVDAKSSGGSTWIGCTVTGNTATTLDCTVPEFGLLDQEMVQFRITNDQSEEFFFWARIVPNE